MLHKKKPLTIKNKAEAYYLLVFASEESYNRYFLSNYLPNYVNRVQYTVVKAIIYSNLPPSRVPCVSNISSSVPSES